MRIATSVSATKLFFVFLIVFIFRLEAATASDDVTFSADNERIYEIQASDGSVLLETLIYETDQKFYLPLGAFAQATDLAITISGNLGTADGFVIDENRPLHISVQACQIQLAATILRLEMVSGGCHGLFLHDDELYVEISLLSKILPADFSVLPYKSQVIVTTKESFPFQQKKDREMRADLQKWQERKGDSGFPIEPSVNQIFSGPLTDLQLGIEQSKTASLFSRTSNYGLNLGAETLGMETAFTISGSSLSTPIHTLTVSKRKAQGGVFAVQSLKNVEFGDISISAIPLISLGRSSFGIFFSSAPFEDPTSYGAKSFRGILLPNWEMELYQNDLYLGKKTVGPSGGVYEFRDIPLYYGNNSFRLVFYGPQGQKKVEYKNFRIESQLLRNRELRYRSATGLDSLNRLASVAQLDQAVAETATLNLSWAHLNSGTDRPFKHLASVGFRDFGENFLYSGSIAAHEHGGRAGQIQVQVPWRESIFGTKISKMDSFNSDVFMARSGILQTSQQKFDFFTAILQAPTILFNGDFSRNHLEDNTTFYNMTLRNSTSLLGLAINHELSYEWGLSPILTGQLSTGYPLGTGSVRANLDYQTLSLKSLGVEVQQNLSSAFNFSLALKHDLIDSRNSAKGFLGKKFESLSVGIQSTISRETQPRPIDYSFGLVLTSALASNIHARSAYFVNDSISRTGLVSVRAFIDKNRNGVFDETDEPLANQVITASHTSSEFITDSNGRATIFGLHPHVATDISLSIRTLDDPSLKPFPKGKRVFAKQGSVTELDLPLVTFGQIDGSIELSSGIKSSILASLHIALVSTENKTISQIKVDRTGTYWFDEVPPGDYRLELAEASILKLPRGVRATVQAVTIPPAGGPVLNQNIRLSL